MGGEPCAGRHVESPAQRPARGCVAPYVVDRVCHPAVAAVELTGRVVTILGQQGDVAEERRVRLAEVGDVGTPIVLLDIDVEVVVARPWHVAGQIVVPDALQVAWQGRIFARGADLHIAAVLEKQGVEGGVRQSLVGLGEHLVGRRSVAAVGTQVNAHTTEQPLIVARVGVLQLVKRFRGGLTDGLVALFTIAQVLEIGAQVEDDGQRRSAAHGQVVALGADGAGGVGRGTEHAAEAHTALAELVEARVADDVEHARLSLDDSMAQQVHRDVNIDGTAVRGLVADGQHLVGVRTEVFAAEDRPVVSIMNAGNGLVERQLAGVVRGPAVRAVDRLDDDGAQGQVGAEGAAVTVHRSPSHFVAQLIVAVEEGTADLAQTVGTQHVVAVRVGLTAPEGQLAQGDGLPLRAAVDHGPQSAVAQRERSHPGL